MNDKTERKEMNHGQRNQKGVLPSQNERKEPQMTEPKEKK